MTNPITKLDEGQKVIVEQLINMAENSESYLWFEEEDFNRQSELRSQLGLDSQGYEFGGKDEHI